jgi:hypothetical protein
MDLYGEVPAGPPCVTVASSPPGMFHVKPSGWNRDRYLGTGVGYSAVRPLPALLLSAGDARHADGEAPRGRVTCASRIPGQPPRGGPVPPTATDHSAAATGGRIARGAPLSLPGIPPCSPASWLFAEPNNEVQAHLHISVRKGAVAIAAFVADALAPRVSAECMAGTPAATAEQARMFHAKRPSHGAGREDRAAFSAWTLVVSRWGVGIKPRVGAGQ